MVDTVYGTPVVHHGGDMIGFHSDMMWLPEHGVGAVILTNGDPGWIIRTVFRRKLLEVLFDGKQEADGQITAQAKAYFDEMAAERKLLAIPADAAASGLLAARYSNAALGEIAVGRKGNAVIFDFGEFSSEVGSRVESGWHHLVHHGGSGLQRAGIRGWEKWRQASVDAARCAA